MPRCPGCELTLDAADLVRHEHSSVLVVHCPECRQPLGRYRRHGASPRDD